MRIEIDATDGVGKTTLISELVNRAPVTLNLDVVPEFANNEVGRAISGVVNQKQFFSLGIHGPIPVSETLVIAGDYVGKVEEATDNESNKVFDRGVASLVVYQVLRLNKAYPDKNWESWIEQLVSVVAKPDLGIILTASEAEIESRLKRRGDKVTTESIGFVMACQKALITYGERNNYQIFENKDGQLNETVDRVLSLISEAIFLSKEKGEGLKRMI